MNRIIITGSSGLIGSEAAVYFDARGWQVHGVDNNMRRDFFGPDGDTTWNLSRVKASTKNFNHHHVDIRDRQAILRLIERVQPHLIVHCAAQPSHDLAKDRPFDDFEVNAVGTLNMLEATRQKCPQSPFIFMSTNKVYGDAPNEKPLKEMETRWEYANESDYHGIDESCRVDATTHSIFGASKLSADVMVQEYGRYFGMLTVCLRGGCLTGPQHSAAELHGFLAYLAKAVREGRPYRVYGYKGKQVRDNIHALDVCRFFEAFYKNPRSAAVYNLGGGRENSVSMLEAITMFEDVVGKKLQYEYVDKNRVGDHICYISDLRKVKADYPDWDISKPLTQIIQELGQGPATASKAKAFKYSLVIPARNESGNIGPTVSNLRQRMSKEGIDYEIVVVDDGSTDNTCVEVQREAAGDTRVRLIQNHGLHGFGRAIRCGLDHFTGDGVAIVMADGSDAPEDVIKYYYIIRDEAECAFGSRWVNGGQVIDYPWFKKYVNRAANLFIRLMFGQSYNDTTNAFKAYRRCVIEGCAPLISPHFNLTVELPLKAMVRGYTHKVMPISWKNRKVGKSSLHLDEMGSRYLFIVLNIWLERLLSKGDFHRKVSEKAPPVTEAVVEVTPSGAAKTPVRAAAQVEANA